jgi:hypothetical protein
MSQIFTIICCEKNSGLTYYTKGIHLWNIPFSEFRRVELQKITVYRRRQFIHNLLPAFIRFQKEYRKRYKRLHSVRLFLKRELTGQSGGRLPW